MAAALTSTTALPVEVAGPVPVQPLHETWPLNGGQAEQSARLPGGPAPFLLVNPLRARQGESGSEGGPRTGLR